MRDLHELPKLRDSLSYLYVEHCRIEQKDSAVELIDAKGCTMVPAAALTVLMLGPGTSITHAGTPGYTVRKTEAAWQCDCPDFARNGLGVCKHTFAVELARVTPNQREV
jgi:hypothetical protein